MSFVIFDIGKLKAIKIPVQDEVGGIKAFFLGWGSNPPQNLAMRKRVGKPGAPFGGLGCFDPQANASEATAPDQAPPEDLTMEQVKRIKMDQFEAAASGAPSIYLFTLQFMWDTEDRARSAEILTRIRNGADSAPYEDILAVMNPKDKEAQETYAKWKVFEILDFTLHCLKTVPALQRLAGISANVRPLDMPTDTLIFKELVRRMGEMSEDDLKLLRANVIVEVTEDQQHPAGFEATLKAWKDLGFRLSYDDSIGQRAQEALKKLDTKVTFHTPEVLMPLLEHFSYVKIDIDWAGFMIFLSHPSYAFRADVKEKVLENTKEKGTILIPKGPDMLETTLTHDESCAELASFCKEIMASGRRICIELTVRADDPSNAFALEKLKGLGIDIFGEHKEFFMIQGGLTGAKSFLPEVLTECIIPGQSEEAMDETTP